MPLMEWDDSYSVGVSSLDNQHKELIQIIDEFAGAFFDGESQRVIAPILSRLIAYTKTHFETEENLMISYGYEGFVEQREEHRALTRRILEFQRRYESGDRDVAHELLDFLGKWMMEHILVVDMKYKEFFREQGVE